MKKAFLSLTALLLALLLLTGSVSFAVEKTRTFTDSLGRTVTVPEKISRIAVSGPMAQLVLFALCPDRLAGVATAWDRDAAEYLPEGYRDLPVLGQLYGGKGALNLETLLMSGADLVIDVGEAKASAKDDLDALEQQTGLPFVHIDAATATMGDTFRLLGELLGTEAEAETLAAYCDRLYADTVSKMANAEKVRLLYITGDKGLNVIARGSYHAEILDLMGDDLAVVDAPSSKGTGNGVDMEQILLWDPDVILFAPESIYASVGDLPEWQTVSAIAAGRYYEVPSVPCNWMGFPPSVQRYLGILWLEKLLYPALADYDPEEAVREYFSLFFHTELTHAQYETLTRNAFSAPGKDRA